jgi:hypothetical protein
MMCKMSNTVWHLSNTNCFISKQYLNQGHEVAQFAEALCYKQKGLEFDTRGH